MNAASDSSIDMGCQECNLPGALRHAPPPAPASGVWCDACFTKLERRSNWIGMLWRFRALWVIALVLLYMFASKVWAAEFTKASDCVVGKRVVTRENQAGVIASVSGSGCRVKLDATGELDYNIFWMLRPEGQRAAAAKSPATTTPKGGGTSAPAGGLATGLYKCYMLAGSQLNYAFIDIRIEGPDSYKDKNGKAGKYRIGDGGKITFTGPLASANAQVLPGERIGLNMNGGNFFNTSCSRPR